MSRFCRGQRWQEVTGIQWALWNEPGKGNELLQNKTLHGTLKRNHCRHSLVAPLIKEVREKEGLTLRDQEHPKASLCFQWDSLQWVPTQLREWSHTPVQDTLSNAFQWAMASSFVWRNTPSKSWLIPLKGGGREHLTLWQPCCLSHMGRNTVSHTHMTVSLRWNLWWRHSQISYRF